MRFYLLIIPFFLGGCSPIRSSPNEEPHKTELTLHQMKTSIDDISHDVRCFKTEMEILDEKIHQAKDQKTLERLNQKQKSIESALESLTVKFQGLEKRQSLIAQDLDQLSSYSENVTLSLKQFKEKIGLIEKNQKNFSSAIAQILELKTSIDQMAQLPSKSNAYKVKPGDSLEKIAKTYKTSVEKLKQINSLKNDLIVVGQELKIP